MLLCKFIQLAKNCVKNSNFSFIRSKSVVSSYNEWDPLEEIIVGRAEGCMHPPATRETKIRITKENWEKFQLKASTPYPSDVVNKAKKQVDEFINVLKGEGVVVRRPEKIDYTKMGKYKTPNFESTGYINTCPRDGTLIIGEEIIEAPMSFKSRYFETEPMKDLFNEYFEGGAKWTLAPKPRMKSDLYYKVILKKNTLKVGIKKYRRRRELRQIVIENFPYYDIKERTKLLHEGKYGLTEKEVAFDAADIIRFGKDIFVYRTIVIC
ncbi:hypothetical protein A3Q56_03006 [Intoshia linei]|uniref:Glycine amidinotransferase n=1 Tax=Intoshia linei TaxID=1819745 RepID=A0A177B536_9BILA|nr:hypothetical protein A3Q56_03006 [Intoshia linei]